MKFLKQIDIYYIVTLLFLLLSANSSILSANSICWFSIFAFLCIVAIGKKKLNIKNLRVIIIFSAVYLIFVAARDFLINDLPTPYFLSDGYFLVKFIFLTFVFCITLQEKAAHYIVKVLFHLTIVSFVFFFCQLIGLNEYIYSFSTSLNLKADNTTPGYTNFIIFSFTKGLHDYRNSGFLWEPGSFGCFLIIGLLLNFFLNKFTFDKKSVVFIIAIITTLSTTDYLALLVVLFLAYRVKVPQLNWWAIMFLIGAAIIILLIPILGDKISDTYYEDMDDLNRLKYLEVFYRHKKMQIPLNRFSSMVYIYDSYKAKLILGVSNKYNDILNKSYNINISNGIFDFLAKFGVVGFIYLLYHYSIFCFDKLKKWEYVIYCILALAIIGFGEPIILLPITLMFIFLPAEQVNLDKLRRTRAGGLNYKAT